MQFEKLMREFLPFVPKASLWGIFTACLLYNIHAEAGAPLLPKSIEDACGITAEEYVVICDRQLTSYPTENWITICKELKDVGLDPRKALLANPDIVMKKTYSVEDQIKKLKTLGFKDPVALIRAGPFILGLHFERKIEPQIHAMKKIGIRDPIKVIESRPTLFGHNVERSLEPKIEKLRGLGFKDPIRLIERYADVLSMSIEDNVIPKIEDMKELGFKNPVRVLEINPSIFGNNVVNNIRPKIEALKNLGFKTPIKMMETYPPIFSLSFARNIEPKIEDLRRLGFRDPVAMIEKAPPILALNIEKNIQPKIEGLKQMGFHDPVKMIERFPQFVVLKFDENIKPTVHELETYWAFSRNRIEGSPRVIAFSLSRLQELSALLRNLDFPIDQASEGRKTQIITLSSEDVLAQLRARGFEDEESQRKAIAESKNWNWIFRKYKVCEDALKVAPSSLSI